MPKVVRARNRRWMHSLSRLRSSGSGLGTGKVRWAARETKIRVRIPRYAAGEKILSGILLRREKHRLPYGRGSEAQVEAQVEAKWKRKRSASGSGSESESGGGWRGGGSGGGDGSAG